MDYQHHLDKVAISAQSHRLVQRLLEENPQLQELLERSATLQQFLEGIHGMAMAHLASHPPALAWYRGGGSDVELFRALRWTDYAAIRILDYLEHGGKEYVDLNLRGENAVTHPFKVLWLACERRRGGGTPPFFVDMLNLFRQFNGKMERPAIDRATVESWMDRHPSGLDPEVVKLRERNRRRIIDIITDRLDRGLASDSRYKFDAGLSRAEKREHVSHWWNQSLFHLRFAVRSPELLNEMLDDSLAPETMAVLFAARDAGIPFFVNPYYLSLLNVEEPEFAAGADLAIRDYVLYSEKLVEEFGNIVAWEKEDAVRPGKPNAAGWLLPPYHNVHRRYPEVAILIPDSTGRACGGLCASCQRMYDFQNGYLNFDLDKLKVKRTWKEKLRDLMAYFENDSQLRDILITGGDALMSSDRTLEKLLDAIYQMAIRKQEANKARPDGAKYAEMVRVRLGTRLPIYLPMRITPSLQRILAEFREKAVKVGIQQFVIQTHFESAMEVTPEAKLAIRRLNSAGWIVTNQLVFTASASRRGHAAKLRKVLNDVGVLPYYTFTVKGYMENHHSFAPNARSVQEAMEEKVVGKVPAELHDALRALPIHAEQLVGNIQSIRERIGAPFLATDRNVLNLPGVGKSLTFRVIGVTRYGRRILLFDHDATRRHSPIIHKMGKVVIIEPKSIGEYLDQLATMGEDPAEYEGLWGFSLGQTEPRAPIYEYPPYAFETTEEFTNLQLSD